MPATAALLGVPVGVLVPLAISVLICVAGLWFFNHDAPRVAEAL